MSPPSASPPALRPPCRDSMSGEEYDTAVEITLDGETFRGCGLLLTD